MRPRKLNVDLSMFSADPFDTSRMWHKVNFFSDLNAAFSFSETGCRSKIKESSLLYYLPIVGGKIIGYVSFPKGISATLNAYNLVQDLNPVYQVHFIR